MLILLPPSETKRAGGEGDPLLLSALALTSLTRERQHVLDALVALSDDEDEAARVLKLSARQRGDIATNAQIWTSPTLPAMDRYTGVVFDALGAATLSATERNWLAEHMMIHSAPFGLVGASDLIPSYRMGAGVRLPGMSPLAAVWNKPIGDALTARATPFVLDLRSEAYVRLGSIPAEICSVFVRVVTRTPDGQTRALNHFNKLSKGKLVRALARSDAQISSPDDFAAWAQASGVDVVRGDAEWQLVTT